MSSVGGQAAQVAPGCVSPSMITGPVIPGSALVGLMVLTPAPAMLKAIVSEPAAALAALMASRSEQWVALQAPSFTSLVELTVKVAAGASWAATQGRLPRIRYNASSRLAEMAPQRRAEVNKLHVTSFLDEIMYTKMIRVCSKLVDARSLRVSHPAIAGCAIATNSQHVMLRPKGSKHLVGVS
ncbi:MAG: hypothetical protein V9H69_20785 [Anaerolineae bacterium]